VNNDSVVRTAFYKYFHPKEALIDQGVVDPEIARVANGRPKEDRRR
jgi:intraflagellar transport protein 52